MKYVLVLAMLIGLTGCATDGFYNVGKAVVKANKDLIPEEQYSKLKRYDTTRSIVKESVKKQAATITPSTTK